MASDAVGDDVDTERANGARMYDYLLGGAHNFAVDRERAEQAIAANPHLVDMARANRSYLGRVVRWCGAQGIDQYLDLGSGVPTVGNVHEIAREDDPGARVAYVDIEPVAVAHAADIIATLGLDTVTVTRADARDTVTVLAAPGVAGLLDLERPVALLAIGFLTFVEGDIGVVLARYRDALPPGSVIAISHPVDDDADPAHARATRATRDVYARSASPVTLRSRRQLLDAMSGLELVEPGLVDVVAWPDGGEPPRPSWMYGAVGRVVGGRVGDSAEPPPTAP